MNSVQHCAVVRESNFLYRCVRCLLEFDPTLRSLVRPVAALNILTLVSRSSCCPDEDVFAYLSAVAPRSRCASHLMSLREQQFVVCGDVHLHKVKRCQ